MTEYGIDIKLKPHQRKLYEGGVKRIHVSHEVPCDNVRSVFEFAKGFLEGVLISKGLSLKDAIFFPADTLKYANTHAKAIYCWKYKGEDGNMYYTFETTFDKGE